MLASTFLGSTGCLNQCQHLCSGWYAYLETTCDEEVDATDVNRCVSDYRSVTQGSYEEDVCGLHLEFVDSLDRNDETYCGTPGDGSGAHAFTLPVVAAEEAR